jgi:hypothetical protein
MGCDIHLHIEVKISGKWHHHSTPSVPRNYALFSKMAGVRHNDSSITPIAQPRGLPKDLTELTRFSYERWKPDAHSESWLNASEILELCEWAREYHRTIRGRRPEWPEWDEAETFGGFLFGNYFSDFARYPEDREDGLEDLRFIFWFDN